MASTEKLSGGIAVARMMMKCGVDHFFYESGGLISDIVSNELDRLGGHPILCRNEKAATNMADGYSRVTGKPSVCYGQAGAAAMMIASMMYEPMYAHSPVVALTGTHPPSERDRWDYQECYEMKSFESTCKFNADVTQIGRLAEYLRTAIQVAVSGCPGPTHVNMAYDINMPVGEMPELYGDSTFLQVPPFRPRPESARVAAAADLLVKAERPVLMCGTGIHLSQAYDELKTLAEFLTIPVVVNPGAKGCFPEDHPLYVGVIGGYGREQANEFVRGADLVFFVATRAGAHTTEEDQRVIHYSGDGGMGYNIAELETMVRRNDEHVPWVVVVNNNSSFAMGRYRFEDHTKKQAPYMKTFDTTTVNWAKIAEGFGCYGARVEKPADMQDALRAAFASGKPGLVEVMGEVRQYIPTGVRRKTATDEVVKAYGVPAIY